VEEINAITVIETQKKKSEKKKRKKAKESERKKTKRTQVGLEFHTRKNVLLLNRFLEPLQSEHELIKQRKKLDSNASFLIAK
jgi:hypothetical protein